MKRGLDMRRLLSDNTIDTIKYFAVTFGLVAALLLIFGFGMTFIKSQYPTPYMVVEAPNNNYTARVYKVNKKEGVTITVSIYDKMSRMYRRDGNQLEEDRRIGHQQGDHECQDESGEIHAKGRAFLPAQQCEQLIWDYGHSDAAWIT
jgi:hypothetical protein